MNQTYGIVVVEGDMGAMESYARRVLNMLQLLVPVGEFYEGMKLRFSREGVTMRYIDHRGQLMNERYKVEDGKVYRWVDE